MRIIAKKGTAFEQTVKTMCERMTENLIGAQKLVEKASGVKPINIFYYFHWGIISRLIPEFDIHPDDRAKIDPHVLRKKKGCESVYVPALRYKAGNELREKFMAFAEEHEITDDPLNVYGIQMVDFINGVSYYIRPVHDTKRDVYMLVCSDSLPNAFDKQKLASQMFEIEY